MPILAHGVQEGRSLGRLQTLSWLLREVAKRVDLLGGRSLAVDAWMSVAEHGICNEGTAQSSPNRVRGLGWCRDARTQDVVLKSEGTRDALEQIAAKRNAILTGRLDTALL
jgi:hypothetical protein